MGIWLKEAMTIEPFSRAELVAGEKGLDRMVVSANMQEVPDVDRWLAGGEILFTAGYAFESMEQACSLMERLDAKGVAAMVIKPGQYLEDVPQKMIEKANKLNFPLFRLPSEIPYMDCILPIVMRITNEHQFAIDRTERIYNQLLQTLLEKKGIRGICMLLQQVIGHPVFIYSPQGQILSCMPHNDKKAVKQSEREFRVFLKTGKQNRMLPGRCNLFDNGICIPCFSGDERLSYLVLECMADEISNSDLTACENSSSMIALAILQERSLIEKEQKIHAQLLEDMLLKKYSDPEIIRRRLAYINYALTDRYVICEIGPDDFESWLLDNMTEKNEAEIQNMKMAIKQEIRNDMHSISGHAIDMEDGVEMAVMFSLDITRDLAFFRKRIGNLLQKLHHDYKSLCFSAGFGREVNSITKVDQSWKEAKLAKKAGKSFHLKSVRKITMFDELGCMSFLFPTINSPEMDRYYEECLGPLVAYDRDNGTDLIHTLEIYFENNQNVRKTSEVLFVHKNSVIYRIKKIEDILGESLSDYETCFNLQMCLRILRIR